MSQSVPESRHRLWPKRFLSSLFPNRSDDPRRSQTIPDDPPTIYPTHMHDTHHDPPPTYPLTNPPTYPLNLPPIEVGLFIMVGGVPLGAYNQPMVPQVIRQITHMRNQSSGIPRPSLPFLRACMGE